LTLLDVYFKLVDGRGNLFGNLETYEIYVEDDGSLWWQLVINVLKCADDVGVFVFPIFLNGSDPICIFVLNRKIDLLYFGLYLHYFVR
jgi:hypothetical protein